MDGRRVARVRVTVLAGPEDDGQGAGESQRHRGSGHRQWLHVRDRPRLLSGMQPTADSLHLGNYLGALVNWVKLQDDYDVFYFVADLHAITVEQDPATLRQRTRLAAAQYLAAGVDPARSVLFVQSHVPEHAQLAWVLQCLTGFGEAGRMTQFKDKSAREGAERATRRAVHLPGAAGRRHPALPASTGAGRRGPAPAPRADPRPGPAVQHSLRRDLRRARAAHHQGHRQDPDLQIADKQMSKSIGGSGCVWLLDDPKVSAKKIRSAVTDTGREVRYDAEAKPGVSNLLTILSALTDARSRRWRSGSSAPVTAT